MTVTTAQIEASGNVCHAVGGTGVSTCMDCGWRGVPVRVDGELLHTCPSCGNQADYEEHERQRLVPRIDEIRRRQGPKVGRNDPCPCGSGLKSKRCCA